MKALEIRPEIRFDLLPIWEGFIKLHNRRQFGMSPNPISSPAIESHLNMMGYMNPDIRREIYEYIAFLDDVWMGLQLTKPGKK